MLKKLKSFFIVDDNPQAEVKSESPKSGASSPQKTDVSKQPAMKLEKPVYDKDNPPKGKPNEKFVNILLGAIESNNVEGFDYLEFKQALQNLSGVEMDEATKFKSALAMAKTMGASKKVLFSSADLYLNVLSREESKFMESFSKQVNIQVNNRNEDITNLEKGIALKNKQIKELQAEIEAQEKALNKKKTSADQASAKVKATKDSFFHAYHIVSEQIKADIEKMKKYLD
jgi:uncharacterized coiled-coil protein SlyX